jgi:hypothetical protein
MNGRTDFLEELISELRVNYCQILCKLAFEGLLLTPGCSPLDCNYSNVAPIVFRSLLIILFGRIIRGLCYLLLKVANYD